MRRASSFRRTSFLANSRSVVNDQQESQIFFTKFFFAAMFHVILALLLYRFRPILPTMYTGVLFLIGLSTLRDESPARFMYICTYISGAELIWRMTGANVFWESGKYLIILLIILGAMRWRVRLQGIGILYFILFVPGMFLTFGVLDFSRAIDAISFNLSGPLALGMGIAFLNGIHLSREQLGKLLLIGILPIISIGALAARSIVTAQNLSFIAESNFAASGGYGPNQVSAILGLGALLCYFYLFIGHPQGMRWWIMLSISGILLMQSILTFSRGGILNLVFAIPAATYFFTRNGGRETRRVFILIVLASILLGWAIPILNNFTGGALQTRYEELDTTGRAQLFRADIQTWQDNPIFGVGVGLGEMFRGYGAGFGHDIAAHTEYSRMLSEHGIFGAIAILLMVIMLFSNLNRARTNLAKGLVVGMMIWTLVEMTHAAMRIAAISFIYALPLVALSMEEEKLETPPARFK